jgi:hypothetical protein
VITLTIIAYVIISLLMARHKYWDMEFDDNYGNISPYFMNGKKSLKYGFLFIPKLLIMVLAVVTIIYGVSKIIVSSVIWIFTNMP